MASAVILRQNESSWAHMGKIPYHLNANPNPKKKPKHHHTTPANGVAGHYRDSPVVTQTASDDVYSFNQTSSSRDAGNYGRYLTFNVASSTKSELLELRKRLSTELEQIRNLQNRIDSGHFSNVGNSRSQSKFKKHSAKEKPVTAFGSVPERHCNGFYGGNVDVDFGASLKECSQILTKLLRNKFAFVFKAPVDAVALGLQDYHDIVKQPMDLGTVKLNLSKNLYATPCEFADDVRLTFNNALLYNPKHDPVHGMAREMMKRFEELFRPIQEKIDSCIKPQRERELHDFDGDEDAQFQRNQELQGNSWSNHNQSRPSPFRGKKVKKQKSVPVEAPQFSRKRDRMQMMPMPMQAHSSASTSSNPPRPAPVFNHQPKQEDIPSPVRAPSMLVKDQKPARSVGTVKQPKPKAKDPNKREMSMEEKQKLGLGLQSLPQEKMPQLVQIIRKRNDHLSQDGDEIELDIKALDTETLWELDRFVANWRKTASKAKRQALITGNDDLVGGVAAPSSPIAEVDTDQLSETNDESPKKLKDVEEDVDIDDDMPAASFPPVMIERDEAVLIERDGGAAVVVGGGQDQHDQGERGGNASSSSSGSGSSSSDSSASSDSDSGSSSGSDSDADDAQS